MTRLRRASSGRIGKQSNGIDTPREIAMDGYGPNDAVGIPSLPKRTPNPQDLWTKYIKFLEDRKAAIDRRHDDKSDPIRKGDVFEAYNEGESSGLDQAIALAWLARKSIK